METAEATGTLVLIHGTREQIALPWMKVPVADPRVLPVELAIVPLGTIPDESDFHACAWDSGDDPFQALAEIGAGTPWDVTVSLTFYVLVGRITLGTQKPWREHGLLRMKAAA